MRHRKASLKLNRTTSHRQAMFRNMVTSLFKHERIRTTGVKAKELRRWADHIITLAKRGDLHARRQALSIIREKGVVHKLFSEANERFGNSAGGYTRIVKLGRRAGDAAPMSLIELVVPETGVKKKTEKKAGKSAAEKKKTKVDKKAEAETKEEKKTPTREEEKGEVKKKTAAKKKAEEEKPKKASREKADSKKSDKKERLPAEKKSAEAKNEEKVEDKSKRASKKKSEKDAKTT
ncbi:MAG: 50S ribosomal protein L17 [Desulfobacterales bacterium]|nr:50S ribosomal protein L17 [Desulfobacterales bacterium]